jgi:glutamyl-tRNA synthetase
MENKNENMVTRFAPSPTGLLHLGTFRTAIFSYLLARKNGGKFILRIEDTDKARSKKEYEENILESFKWLGMEYDEMYRQSDNLDRHRFFLTKMIEEGNAYVSKEEAKDGSGVIKEIVRFKNPNIPVSFHDEIKGLVTMDTTDLGDFVIARNINDPLFHLAVVVDDFEEGVTHVIRGEDHVSNTPRQILLQRAIGAPTPIYAHIPLVLGADKQKLSKRKGALSVLEYRDKGFLPEALLNGATMVGWNPGTEKEIFTPKELIEAFDLSKVQKSPAVLSEEKLRWFNKEHIKLLSESVQKEKILEYIPKNLQNLSVFDERFEKVFPTIIEHIETFGDVTVMSENGGLEYFFKTPKVEKEGLICPPKLRKDLPITHEDIAKHISEIVEKLETTSDFTAENIKALVWDYASEHGRGVVLWAMRFALSGREKSPDPFAIASIIGKDETLARLRHATSL